MRPASPAYAERYASGEGTGLTSSSASLVRDLADFWMQEFGLDLATITAPANETRAKKEPAQKVARKAKAASKKVRFTPRQGQFLAFVHLYREPHGELVGTKKNRAKANLLIEAEVLEGVDGEGNGGRDERREPSTARGVRVRPPLWPLYLTTTR